MNWKNEAIEVLRNYEAKAQALKSIPERMSILKNSMSNIRSASADGTPVKGGGSGREDMLLNNLVEQEELKKSFLETRRWVKWVNGGLDVLTNEEKLILERFFILPEKGAAERLAGDLHLDVKTVYKRRDIALNKFTRALYGYLDP